MALIGACVPHYIIGIALGAGLFGFFMLCQVRASACKVHRKVRGLRRPATWPTDDAPTRGLSSRALMSSP